MKPVVFGMSGLCLTDDEKAFFRDSDPAGYIIFGRNIESKEQLRALTDELRDLHGRDDVAILIDQEGGRVARMTEPVWPKFPAGGRFGELYEKRQQPLSRPPVSMPRRSRKAFGRLELRSIACLCWMFGSRKRWKRLAIGRWDPIQARSLLWVGR